MDPNSTPKISIITACYNSESTIARTLRSVEEQDWPNVEHIIIDGASTDQTLSILQAHTNGTRTILSEPDKGVYDAMNKGLARAHGDIICFLNADDEYASADILSQVVSEFQTKCVDAVYGDVGFFRENKPDKIIRHYRSAGFKPAKLAWGIMPPHPALFLTGTLVKTVGTFNTEYKIAGDYEYIIRCFKRNETKFSYLPKILVHMQAGGISNKDLRARLLLNQEVLRACHENGIPTNLFKILSKYPKKILEYLQI